MIEIIGGMAGGLGLFFAGMWFLTENLKTLASRRLRLIANRWTGNRFAAFAWGTIAGTVTQSTAMLTFIVVSMLRSGFVSTRGAFAILLGGSLGVVLLVLVVTFDIKLISLYVLGIASAVMISERGSKYRPIAASFFGGAMIILGLVLLKDSAAPLVDQPWFGETVEWMGGSLLLAFLVAALLTTIVQSPNAISVLGISMATLGVIPTDQAIMLLYGSCLGAGLILYLLSMGFTGRARQVAMYQVIYCVLVSAIMVLLLYIELYFDVPLMKATFLSIDLGLGQQLALIYISTSMFGVPIMLVILGPTAQLFKKLWPATVTEELSQTKFIDNHALGDVETSLALADLEQRRVLDMFPRYFNAVRQGTELQTPRKAVREVLSEIDAFLIELRGRHSTQSDEGRSSMLTRQKLLFWLEEQLAVLCGALQELNEQSALHGLRASFTEGIDAVLLSMLHAVETGDKDAWKLAKKLTGNRRKQMSTMRRRYLEMEQFLDDRQRAQLITVTNSAEQTFFLLSKLAQEFDNSPIASTHVLMKEHAR